MGIPSDPLLDIMRRSLINLKFIDDAYEGPNGKVEVYEITQLINTFLGALVHPFEASRASDKFEELLRNKEAPKNYIIKNQGNQIDYYNFIRLLRNGLCHGNIKYNEGRYKNIESVDIWNKNHANIETFRCKLFPSDMKDILEQFSMILESIYKK